jgi:hypothetical protein
VSKGGVDRDNLREDLKAKGRSRRESARRGAEASLASPLRRNDLLPALKIESCPLEHFLVRLNRRGIPESG